MDLGFTDDKRDGLNTDSELDPVDEILKRINDNLQQAEGDIALPEQDTELPTAVIEPPDEELPPDEDLCVRCNKKRRDDSVAPDYEFCADCRAAMLATRLPWQGVLAAVAITLLAALSIAVAAFTSYVALPVMQAKDLESQKKLSDAMASYNEAQTAADELNKQFDSENFFTPGTKTFVKKMQLTARASSPLTVGSTLSEAIKKEKAYRHPWLRALKEYPDIFARFKATQEAVAPIVQDYQNTEPGEVPYEDLIAELEALRKSENAANFDLYLIEYYKTYAAVLADKGAEEELKHMLKVKELAPDAGWLYNFYLADCYKRLERYDEVIRIADEILKDNVNSVEIYSVKARAFAAEKKFDEAFKVSEEMEKNNPGKAAVFALNAELYRRNNDVDAALKWCEDGLTSSEGSTELYRQQAICLLLKKDYKAAFEAANNAYQSAYYNQDTTIELMNTIALCAALADEEDMLGEVTDSLEQNGYELAADVRAIIDGDKTLKEVFITGKGDVL